MGRNDTLDDREPEPDAPFVSGHERREELITDLIGDTGTGIGNGDPYPLAVELRRDLHPSLGRTGFERSLAK